ncbi:MAG: DUF721 domain-containing protein [candidate division WOR-3 bacterium]|nr:DUF721 domain-containing protein [candidate division WOR-3 bacterium]
MSKQIKPKKLKPLADLLPRVFDKLGLTPKLVQEQVISLWPKAVGEQIAKNARPIKIKGKTLIVLVSNPIWRNELIFLKSKIINKLNVQIGEKAITDIKFRLK